MGGVMSKPHLARVRSIFRHESEYPFLLAEISSPPDRLYAQGRPLTDAPHVAIVGTRTPTRYGLDVARWVAGALASCGVVIVSGMARGIDAAAHRGALEAGGTTVAVLGTGIDVEYPKANRKLREAILESGTLVTEFEPGIGPYPSNFPTRNRIVAGMSLGVVVVESRLDGGGMITARLGADFGREVFAVPGPVHSPLAAGPHALINDGAKILTSPADVLEELGLRASGPASSSASGDEEAGTDPAAKGRGRRRLAPDEELIVKAMSAHPSLLDSIAAGARIPTPAASAVLARLELEGLVARHPGGRFALTARS
jgi:DNA processing protein